MKIKRIYVENVQAFKQLEYFPEDNINLLLGENGSGKSSFVEIFDLLTMIYNKDSMSKQLLKSKDTEIISELRTVFSLYDNYSTIGDEDDIKIDIDFELNKKNGSYAIHINKDNEICYESMDYALNSRKANIYKRFSSNEVITNYNSIKNAILKYDLALTSSVVSHIDFLSDLDIIAKGSSEIQFINAMADSITAHHQYHKNSFHMERLGVIQSNIKIDSSVLENFKDMVEDKLLPLFREFVYQIDSNVIDVIYKRTYLENEDKYEMELYFTKLLGGKELDVPFSKESTGTQKYLDYFNFIHHAKINDSVFIWDEFGAYLHDNLARKVFDYTCKIMKQYDRQMFVTTHNIYFIDSKVLTNKEKQLIENIDGQRKIRNLAGIDNKDKISKRYLEGYYGAIPSLSDIWEENE
ncbi:ATP-binding protein [Mollicutes bacterium LVI A0039]|nr:ATP-binding protein [Mollicutes bacterium LVI A0039]